MGAQLSKKKKVHSSKKEQVQLSKNEQIWHSTKEQIQLSKRAPSDIVSISVTNPLHYMYQLLEEDESEEDLLDEDLSEEEESEEDLLDEDLSEEEESEEEQKRIVSILLTNPLYYMCQCTINTLHVI